MSPGCFSEEEVREQMTRMAEELVYIMSHETFVIAFEPKQEAPEPRKWWQIWKEKV